MEQVLPIILPWSNSPSLVTFQAAQDTVNSSLFSETLPSSDSSVPRLAESSLLTLQLWPPFAAVNVRLLQDEVLDCLLLSLGFLSQSDLTYLHGFRYHPHHIPRQCEASLLWTQTLRPTLHLYLDVKKMPQVQLVQAKCTFPSTTIPSQGFFPGSTISSPAAPPRFLAQATTVSALWEWSLKWPCASQWVCRIAHWNTGNK